MRIILLFILCFALAACASHSYPKAQTQLSPRESVYTIQENDVLLVRVYREKELTGRYIVDSQGKIAMPLLGKVIVRGMSEPDAARYIGKRLSSEGYLTNPKISIEIYKTRPFFVVGEVEKRGEFPFKSGITVYQAVALAGGYTYRADRDDIIIRRVSNEKPISYSAQEDTPVLPGDLIEIGERFF